jgi:hypothetical protein
VSFSWIADVFIAPALRGRGLGKWMIRCILEHPDVKDTRQALGTEVLRRYPGAEKPPAY